MLKIALITDGPELVSHVEKDFSSGTHLLIADAESSQLLRSIPRNRQSDLDLAREIVNEDCEAVICGPIEEQPFVIIADEGCATRYNGAGLHAMEAIEKMNDYDLSLITDFIGGTGCHSGDESNCGHHHHD